MNKKSIIILLVLLSGIVCLTWSRFKKITIENVGQSQTVTLVADNKYVYGLEAYIEGHLDDTAKISNIILPAGNVKTWLFTGDCYVDTFRLIYEPYKARSGVLTVKYRFKTN